jgi:hypothetical protein
MPLLCNRSHAQNAKQPPISPSAASAYQKNKVTIPRYPWTMSLGTLLCFLLIAVGMCSAADTNPPLACNLKAINAAEQPRYTDLMKRLRASLSKQTEIANGFTYVFDAKVITLPEVAEWITMERLCCPFLTFQLDVKSSGDSSLTLRGPNGVKAILREEFPATSVR